MEVLLHSCENCHSIKQLKSLMDKLPTGNIHILCNKLVEMLGGRCCLNLCHLLEYISNNNVLWSQPHSLRWYIHSMFETSWKYLTLLLFSVLMQYQFQLNTGLPRCLLHRGVNLFCADLNVELSLCSYD